MELRHLRYFVAVAETRHFGRAAKQLNMAQPPLSQAIRQLEAELGAELFTRTTRQVQLTPAGAAFRDDALRILKSLDDAARRVRRVAEGCHGVLRLGLTGSASYRHLPRLAHIVQRELPGVELEIHSDMLTAAQEKALLQNSIDVGLLRPPTREDGIVHRTVAREPLVLVLPVDHPLAGEPEVSMARLRGERFIMYAAALRSVVNDAVVRSCLAAGFYPQCAHEIGEASIQVALVAAGLGVALAPASVQSIPLEGVVFAAVPDAATVELALAWRADDDSPLLRNLLTALAANDVFISRDDEEVREDHAG
ncbi:LysR family transcriptional regulator [Saccharopolyspora subtropica]|uniref:LysR family transcriptional regulator n=1 Tax=Saccharopolyspora thermophila TaxID=89367 RepID=A0A917NEZ8_9PSEU|nr:LysR substrate-binding domain-containing protein [Saccharopolyspora subtropica]GGI91461.1 LysR family transcriptional regulator [Saccharopolyspora subtropica]